MKIALCQLNPVMGDIAGNTAKLIAAVSAHRDKNIDLFVFPELIVQGYPPRDLLEQSWFVSRGAAALRDILAFSKKIPESGVLFGFAMPSTRKNGKRLSNAALLVCKGKIVFQHDKSLLPAYDVFDEARYFDAAAGRRVCPFKGERLGITVCEDAWNDPHMWQRLLYDIDPVKDLARKGATILLNLSASPFYLGKEKIRFSLVKAHAKRHRLPFVFVNQAGGNDELIFDGNSMAFDATGALRAMLPAFSEAVRVVDTRAFGPVVNPPEFDTIKSVHDALVCGISDYLRKCGFTKALVGLSGGIDSAVTAALAVDALGPNNVWGVTMPSRYSSSGSVGDSAALAKNLGITFTTIPIESAFSAFTGELEPVFAGLKPDLAEENIQARVRGTVLMALSNKFGHILLSTGNKSELAVGYCTLYGDMSGGLSVISDLPKGMVYKMAHYINRVREIIPANCISKPPSAELRPGQKDQDTLPPYDVLDPIIELFVEEGKSAKEIVKKGFDGKTVAWVVEAVKKSEYKRRQAAPGLKVTPKAFGVGRRFPLAAKYEC
ncbi:MAG TPA: NAD+ synthase [Chitinivibrionales bacterium]|nr:NAD+ synthase [Chitinivibrionales bacterium]